MPIAEEPRTIRLTDKLLQRAVKEGASDIHLEPKKDQLRIRFRVDGVLQERAPLPLDVAPAIVSRFKVLARMDIAEKRVPQDGTFEARIDGRNSHFRASTFPSCWGEKLVLRILSADRKLTNLRRLGIPQHLLPQLEQAVQRPSGLILATGPTGSGKTTTLYSLLETLDQVGRNIVTLEDPIEIRLPRLTQAQTNAKAGFTFANGLRAILRQDPDVVLVGEMRDLETAEIAFRASLTGHLVLSTLHTSSTIETITRMLDMGLEPFVVASALSLVIAQRLVRELCPHCAEPFEPEAGILRLLEVEDEELPEQLWRARGCSRCNRTGYRGRVGLFEVVLIDDEMRDLIKTRSPTHEFRRILAERRAQTLRRAGWELIKEGRTTLSEVVRVC